MQLRPMAPPAGAALTPMRQDTVKQRVKELEILLEKAREELAESEAEKFSLATPTVSKADDDEIGIEEMIKSPGTMEMPPGIESEDADGKERGGELMPEEVVRPIIQSHRTDEGGIPAGPTLRSTPNEPGKSSKDGDGKDPFQDARNDDWAKAKEKEARKDAPDWVVEMIIQQNETMK